MMRIVVPLRVEVAPQMLRGVAFVLQHEMDMTAGLDGGAHLGRHLVEPVGLGDGVHGVEAQPVETIFEQPVERVLGEEAAHLGSPEIDGAAPRRGEVVAEEARRVGGEIVPVRAEVIVDDVEEDHEAEAVRGIDEGLQLVRRAVAAGGRERQHAVVAPVARAGKFVDRHQLDGRDSQRREAGQRCLDAGEAAEKAGMQLVEDGLAPRPAAPSGMLPAIGAGIDDQARPVDVIGLGARGGIGHRQAIGQAIAVARARAAGRLGLEPALGRSRHRHGRVALDLDRDRGLRRRPQAKARAVGRDQGRAEWQDAGKAAHESFSLSRLSVNTTLRAATTISSRSRSRSGASGWALSSSSRAGRPGGGRRKV